MYVCVLTFTLYTQRVYVDRFTGFSIASKNVDGTTGCPTCTCVAGLTGQSTHVREQAYRFNPSNHSILIDQEFTSQ